MKKLSDKANKKGQIICLSSSQKTLNESEKIIAWQTKTITNTSMLNGCKKKGK